MKSQFPPSLDEDEPLYKTDSFRMFCFKVLPCSKRFCHDWTTCPFAHPAEKAKRRDPRVHVYTGVACPDQKKNACCPRGDACTFAHSCFEYHLHPSRYRTALCNDGVNCSRKICFFAHTMDELRVSSVKVVPPESAAAKLSSPASDNFDMDPFNCQAEDAMKPKSSTSPVSPFYMEPTGSEVVSRRPDLHNQQKPKRMSHELARSQYKHTLLQKQRSSVDVAELQMQQMRLRSLEAALNAQMQLQMQQTSLQGLAMGHHEADPANVNQLAQALAHFQLASRMTNQEQLLPAAMPPLPPQQQSMMPNLTQVLMQQLMLQQQAQQQQQAQEQLMQQLQASGHQPAHAMCNMSGHSHVVGLMTPGLAGLSAARGARPSTQALGGPAAVAEYGTS